MRRKSLPRNKSILFAALVCFVVSGWSLLFYQQECGTAIPNRSDYVRLHILANSDSIEDQKLKLKVRDAVVAYVTPYVKDVQDAKEAENTISSHKEDIIRLAKHTLAESGANYGVDVQLGNFEFPVRSYGSLILPAGDYRAVRILLGDAAGQNWWCVLFPPLCFIDGSNASVAPMTASADAGSSEGTPVPKIRWKVAEIFNK